MKKLFLFIVAIFATSTLWADGFYSGDLYYNITSSSEPYTAEVTSAYNYVGFTIVTIPSTVTYNGITYCVTSIDGHAFSSCSKLTSVTIPESVKSIGARAFSSCSALTSINIPEGVTNIESYTFENCSSLTSITIPNSVTRIEYCAFNGTGIYNDESNWENDVLYIDNCLIGAKISKSGAYTIKENTRLIAGGTFKDCSSLTSVTIPNGVTSIGEYAFSGCSALTSITIPNSVTSIGSGAFSSCSALTSINIPEGVTNIELYTFENCSSLTSITIPNSVTSIGHGAFGYCSSLTSATMGNSVTSFGELVFQDCKSLKSIVLPNTVQTIGGGLFSGCEALTSVVLPENLDSLLTERRYHLGFFENCHSLSSITLPEYLIAIGDHAFYNCSSLTSIAIPNSVTSIGDGAFRWCSSLTSVTIPNSVMSIGCYAFDGTPWYANLSDGVIYIGQVLYTYKGNMPANTSIDVKEGTTAISPQAFSTRSSLVAITLPESLITIGNKAFSNCSSLTAITLPESLITIEDYAFSDCSLLTAITLPKGLNSVGYYAFKSCHSLTSVTWNVKNHLDSYSSYNTPFCDISSQITSFILGDSVQNIPAYLCYKMDKLTSVTIPNSVTSIGGYAFSGCLSLTKTNCTGDVASWCNIKFGNSEANPMVYSRNFYINDVEIKDLIIPSSVDSIHKYAFSDCSSLTSVIIPNSVTSIGNYAFDGCDSLSFVVIGSGVTSIEYSAFRDCPIDTVYSRNPTPPQLKSSYSEKPFTSKPICYIPCGAISSYKNSTWKSYMSQFIEGNVYFLNTNVSDSLAGRVETIKDPHCDEGATFQAIPNVGYEFVQWSDGVTDALRTLDLTQDTTLIAEFRQLFDGKCGDNLYWKHYDDKIIIHGEGAMYDYAADSVPWYQFRDIVKTVEVFDGATSIGNNAFTLCKNLNTLTLSGTIENIGENAFSGCRMLFDIYCYILFPPIASENSFVNYNAYLYILCDYQRYYEADMVFGNFRNMQCIGTQSTPTDGMVITPSYNDVTITWPTESNAGSYTLAINKDGEVFCTLTFNAAGQLTGIAFAPSRNGQRHAPAATQATNGFTFTVTGLEEGTDYSYNLVIKDNRGKTLQTYSGEFRTQSTSDRTVTVEYDATQGQVTGAGVYQVGDTVTLTAIPNDGYRFVRWSNEVEDNPYSFVISENIILSAEFSMEQTAVENITTNENIQKILRNGQLLILRDGVEYTIMGQEL